jgi:hypothetical protein
MGRVGRRKGRISWLGFIQVEGRRWEFRTGDQKMVWTRVMFGRALGGCVGLRSAFRFACIQIGDSGLEISFCCNR